MSKRELKDMSHEYLVECVQLIEAYTATMLQMILDHHPYMQPVAQQIGQKFQAEHALIEEKYPVIKPH